MTWFWFDKNKRWFYGDPAADYVGPFDTYKMALEDWVP